MSAAEAAWGVLTVLATNCTTAMRTITVERGYDPREFTLVPFGGMGPTIARQDRRPSSASCASSSRAIPARSAPGACWSPTCTRSTASPASPRSMRPRPRTSRRCSAPSRRAPSPTWSARTSPAAASPRLRHAGMRYRGQSYEVSVPVAARVGAGRDGAPGEGFPRRPSAPVRAQRHERDGRDRELQGDGRGRDPQAEWQAFPIGPPEPPAPIERRRAWFGPSVQVEVPVYRRRHLAPGNVVAGPAIIEEQTSTTVLYPGQTARVDAWLNLEIDVAQV